MILSTFKHIFATLLSPLVQLDEKVVFDMIEMPPNTDLGDLAFPCFTLAKTFKKAPQVLASEIASQLEGKLPVQFVKIHAVGPYINVFLNSNEYINEVLRAVDSWQLTVDSKKWKILLEYMSANPNKPLHIGQARNICIGDTLRRVYQKAWYEIQTSDYGDDSGVNVGYNIVGHLYYDLPLDPIDGKKFDHYCGEIYLQMRWKEEDPAFKEKLSQTLYSIEHNDNPTIMELHKKYVKKCTIEQFRTCRRIWASFTMINRETDILHLDLFHEALETLKTKWHVTFATEGDAKWCWIVDLSSIPLYQKEEKQYAILVKSDGVATYVAKDIAFAMRKLGYLEKKFNFYPFVDQPDWSTVYSTTSDESAGDSTITFGDYNQAITIIDNRQIPAQMVVKSSLELLWLLHAEKQYTPLWYWVVYLTPNTLLKWWFALSDEEKSMARLPFASRKWWTVTMDHMLDVLRDRAYEETKKRNEDKDDTWLLATAENIAVSSFRFFLIKTDIMKDITFDIDEVLDMEWETGAYVLYTNARIKAVIGKATQTGLQDWEKVVESNWQSLKVIFNETGLKKLTHPLELQLVKKIDELSGVIDEVISWLAPHLLTRYLISACQLFNTYYNDVNVSKSEDIVKAARVFLLEKLGETLEKAMDLIGMKPVERM
jgi:arginyl-tRNA synthetase